MEGDDLVKKMIELDMRFDHLENSSEMHYEGFDEVKAELFNVQSMCK
jgi:hypothetical protein